MTINHTLNDLQIRSWLKDGAEIKRTPSNTPWVCLLHPDGRVGRYRGKCSHSGYITYESNNYPYEDNRGPYCPACKEAVEL